MAVIGPNNLLSKKKTITLSVVRKFGHKKVNEIIKINN